MPTPWEAVQEAIAVVAGGRPIVALGLSDVANLDDLAARLASVERIGAFVLNGVLGQAAEPEPVLRRLAEHSLGHGGPPLLVSEQNAGHHRRALRLLAGLG